MSFRRLHLWKQQYIRRFNLKYPIEKTYNAPFWYKFYSTAFKKHLCPITELRKITKKQAKTRFSRHYILGTYNPNLIELILNSFKKRGKIKTPIHSLPSQNYIYIKCVSTDAMGSTMVDVKYGGKHQRRVNGALHKLLGGRTS